MWWCTHFLNSKVFLPFTLICVKSAWIYLKHFLPNPWTQNIFWHWGCQDATLFAALVDKCVYINYVNWVVLYLWCLNINYVNWVCPLFIMLKYQKENVIKIHTGKLWVFQETLSLGSNTLINFFIIFQETLLFGRHSHSGFQSKCIYTWSVIYTHIIM